MVVKREIEERKNNGKRKKKNPKPVKTSLFKRFKPEIYQSIIVVLVFNLCFFSCFGQYSIDLITENINDDSELATSGLFLSIAGIVDLSVKLIGTYFNALRYRKSSMIVGLLLYSITQFFNAYF